MKSATIRRLVKTGHLPLSEFDQTHLFAVWHPDYPDERLIACRNAKLANKRARVREELLQATENKLAEVIQSIHSRRLKGKAAIGIRVGAVINARKMKKHFIWQIDETGFTYQRNTDSIAMEAVLDGIYVIRTSLAEDQMSASECVKNYKRLCQVEQAFRCIKTTSLKVRPVHHRSGRTCEGTYLYLHAGFLCGVAHA